MSLIPLTVEQKIEIAKCSKSPVYFAIKYVYIRHPIKGLIKFKPYPYQIKLLTAFQENQFTIILKSRQTGISTVVGIYIAWLIAFKKMSESCIVSNKQLSSMGLIKRISIIIDKCPKWLVPHRLSDNKSTVDLSNGSRVMGVATTSDAARSESLTLLVLDECVKGDTKIKIKNKITNEIREISIEDLMKLNEYK